MRSAAVFVLLPLACTAFTLDASIASQGNKRRVAYSHVTDVTIREKACAAHVKAWTEWDGGFSARIAVHDKGEEAIEKWSAVIELDRTVYLLDSDDGEVNKTGGANFTVKAAPWNNKADKGEEREFNVYARFSPDSVAPKLKALTINDGQRMECIPKKHEVPLLKKGKKAEFLSLPKKVLGLYILLADDSEKGFESENDTWTPELFDWQQTSSNVLFFTFIHPDTMDVPTAFQKLAATRGTSAPGAVPATTVILFAIGGYAYSIKPNPWHWLESKEAAEKMAEKVAEWPDKYGCDGIDLDLEEGAGHRPEAGPNMVHFIRKLKELQPKMIITQPTYGYPQVKAEIDVINDSWDKEGKSQNLADAIGLMVYEGDQALNYVKNYVNGSSQWEGFPVKVNVPPQSVLLGAKGSSSPAVLEKLAKTCVDPEQNYLGIMVWYASVKNGFDYAPNWDASTSDSAISGYKTAYEILTKA